jgi:hypothetical protein
MIRIAPVTVLFLRLDAAKKTLPVLEGLDCCKILFFAEVEIGRASCRERV